MAETRYWRAKVADGGEVIVTDDIGYEWFYDPVINSAPLLAHVLPQTAKLVREYVSLRDRLVHRLDATDPGSPESDSILDDLDELEAGYRSNLEATQAAELWVLCDEQEG
jgi:hypothetical protein